MRITSLGLTVLLSLGCIGQVLAQKDGGVGAGFTLNPFDGVSTSEAGGTDTFTVVADALPTFEVTIDIRSQDPGEGLVSSDGITFAEGLTLTFSPANWNMPQTVTVRGQDDEVFDGDVAYTIATENIASEDPAYDALTDGDVEDVLAINLDDDPPPAIVTNPSVLTLSEDGPSMIFTVRLLSQPDVSEVTVPVVSGDLTEATVSPASLIFSDVNYATPQNVTVTPIDDFMIDGDITFEVTMGPAVGGNFTGLTDVVSVTVQDITDCGVMSLDVGFSEESIAYGTPTCPFDLYKTNNASNPADWTYLGSFVVGFDGSVNTGVLGEADCSYVTTLSGTFIVLTNMQSTTVPLLGAWGLTALVGLLATVGVALLRRGRETLSS